MADRRATPRNPGIVYLLWVDGFVLDVYTSPSVAFHAADAYMHGSKEQWTRVRPNRWYGDHGRRIEVDIREIRTRVVASTSTVR